MAKYKWGENFAACRFQVDFGSHVKFSTLMGFCYGIAAIPVVLLLNISELLGSVDIFLFIILLVFTPLSGVLYGFFMGIIGYPVYKYILNKTQGMTFTGKFVSLVEDTNSDNN